MKKRAISALLVCLMLCTMLGIPASAMEAAGAVRRHRYCSPGIPLQQLFYRRDRNDEQYGRFQIEGLHCILRRAFG